MVPGAGLHGRRRLRPAGPPGGEELLRDRRVHRPGAPDAPPDHRLTLPKISAPCPVGGKRRPTPVAAVGRIAQLRARFLSTTDRMPRRSSSITLILVLVAATLVAGAAPAGAAPTGPMIPGTSCPAFPF